MAEISNAFAYPTSTLAVSTSRLHGAVIARGDTVMAPLGLSSGRWQVMGAIAEADGALPVAGVARNMGLVPGLVAQSMKSLPLAAKPHDPCTTAGASLRS